MKVPVRQNERGFHCGQISGVGYERNHDWDYNNRQSHWKFFLLAANNLEKGLILLSISH